MGTGQRDLLNLRESLDERSKAGDRQFDDAIHCAGSRKTQAKTRTVRGYREPGTRLRLYQIIAHRYLEVSAQCSRTGDFSRILVISRIKSWLRDFPGAPRILAADLRLRPHMVD